MKKNLTLLSYFMLALTLVFTACKEDDPTPEEETMSDLNGNWTITDAVVGTETISLTGVTINFSSANNTYALTGIATLNDNNLNHDEVFAVSGEFSLNEALDNMTLTPGGIVAFTVTDTALTLTYSSSYPKATSEPQSITLTATKQ